MNTDSQALVEVLPRAVSSSSGRKAHRGLGAGSDRGGREEGHAGSHARKEIRKVVDGAGHGVRNRR